MLLCAGSSPLPRGVLLPLSLLTTHPLNQVQHLQEGGDGGDDEGDGGGGDEGGDGRW